MNRDQKATAIAEIGEELDSASAVFAVDYRGISVPQAAELRTQLREADASFSVVKNRLAKRATEDAGASDLDEHLVGPTALTFVRGDAVLAAKAIADFSKKNGVLAYKGGLMDGAALDPDQFMTIARLPGVDVLRGQLVGVAASPLTGIVRTLNQLISGLASQLGQVAEQGLVGGEPAAAAEPEAGAKESEEAAVDAEPPAEPEEADAPEQTSEDAESSEDSESDEQTSEEAPADEADTDSEDEKEN
jgi:large subunit ribosomal protein L10